MSSSAGSWDLISIDAYGTIFDASPVFEMATVEVARHHGGLDARKLSQVWGRHFNEVYHAITDCESLPDPFPTIRDLSTTSLERTLREFNLEDDPKRGTEIWFEHLMTIRLYDDVIAALQALQGRCRLILTSDADEDFLLPVLNTLGLPFEHIFVSETFRTYKMARQGGLLEVALRRVEADPSRVVHVGDSAADLIAAQRAGCRGVWLQRPGQPPPPGHTPWRTITSLHHLADL
ncbi:MAG TPA: HAD-IA family hydrolase [Planctomycetota bacterium]|nr:HAD-IA family hydrolase [Planctomycetota bacterium]